MNTTKLIFFFTCLIFIFGGCRQNYGNKRDDGLINAKEEANKKIIYQSICSNKNDKLKKLKITSIKYNIAILVREQTGPGHSAESSGLLGSMTTTYTPYRSYEKPFNVTKREQELIKEALINGNLWTNDKEGNELVIHPDNDGLVFKFQNQFKDSKDIGAKRKASIYVVYHYRKGRFILKYEYDPLSHYYDCEIYDQKIKESFLKIANILSRAIKAETGR